MNTTNLACLVLACLLATACSGPAPESGLGRTAEAGAPTAGGTATIGTHREPTTFIDFNAQTSFDLIMADLVLSRLARPGAEPGSFVPDLASSWEVLEDGRSIRFNLRDDARWSDGQAVTAEDVLFSHRRAAADGSPISDRKNEIEDVQVMESHEILFRFTRAYPEMLADAVSNHIYPRHLLEEVDAQALVTHPFNRQPVGSGPFVLETWEPQQFIALARSETSHRAPLLERLVVRIFKDKSAVYREMEAGQLDFFRRARLDVYERLTGLDHVTGLREPSSEYVFVAWNTQRNPWSRREVRRALTALVDRPAIARHFEGPAARVAEGPVHPGHPEYDETLTSPAYDPVSARAALKGIAGGAKLTILAMSQHPLQRDIASILAEQFRQGGFDAEVRAVEQGALLQKAKDSDFDAVMFVRSSKSPVDLPACFASDAIDNWAGLEDEELDTLLGQGPKGFDAAYRRIVDLQPWTFLYYRSNSVIFNTRLNDVDANPGDPIAAVEGWWIPEPLR